jgi:hypothetical protein
VTGIVDTTKQVPMTRQRAIHIIQTKLSYLENPRVRNPTVGELQRAIHDYGKFEYQAGYATGKAMALDDLAAEVAKNKLEQRSSSL